MYTRYRFDLSKINDKNCSSHLVHTIETCHQQSQFDHNVELSATQRAKIEKRVQPLGRFISATEESHVDVVLTQIGARKSPYYFVSVKVTVGSTVTMSVHSSRHMFLSLTAVMHTINERLRRRRDKASQHRQPMHVSPLLQAASVQSW